MPVPSQILHRVIHIQNPHTGGTGSAFFIEIDEVEYICTARHIFDKFASNEIDIRYGQKRISMQVDVVGIGRGDDDVIVFRPAKQFGKVGSGALPIQISAASMVFTQEAFVLGYPFQWENSALKRISGGWPFPIAKRAIIAGWPDEDFSKSILLDCQVNPGFSGGPVVFNIFNTRNWAIAGIVKSSYDEPIQDLQDLTKTPVPTGFSAATGIRCATDLIAGLSSDALVE